jgi:hypothetical protein
MCNKSSHRINDIELTPYLSESSLIKGLGEDIGKFIIGSRV